MTRKTCPECKLKKGHRMDCDVGRFDSIYDSVRLEQKRLDIKELQAECRRLQARIDWRKQEGR